MDLSWLLYNFGCQAWGVKKAYKSVPVSPLSSLTWRIWPLKSKGPS